MLARSLFHILNGNAPAAGGGSLTTVTYTTLSAGFSESPTGEWKSSSGSNYGLATLSLAASTDGTYQSDYANATTDKDAILGLDIANTNTDYGGYDYGVFISSVTGNYAVIVAGTPTAAGTTVSAATGQKMRLKRTGSTITAEYYNGTTWGVVHTFAATTTAKLYVKANAAASGNRILNPKGTGLT